MAEITPKVVSETNQISILSGEILSIRILNSDGSLKTDVSSDTCPSGKTFTGYVMYNGTLG